MSVKLGGCLIGYGIKRNGIERKVLFEKPIHNTMTAACLKNLLTFNGSNDLPTGNYVGNWLSQYTESSLAHDRYGVFNFCALGDGTGDTNFNDIELKHRITDYTSVKKTGSGWYGSTEDRTNAKISYRFSHTHTINSNITVREIGLYNRIYPTGEYTLSSRVLLENPIELQANDEFYSIYELTVSFPGIERFYNFGGIAGLNGYSVNSCFVDWGTWYGIIKYDNANSAYPYNDGYTQRGSIIKPIFLFNQGLGNEWHTYSCFATSSNWDKQIAPIYFGDTPSRIIFDSYIINLQIKDYTAGNNYRDATFDVAPAAFLGKNITGIIIGNTYYRFGDFDSSDNFTPRSVQISNGFRFTYRQSFDIT